MDNTLDVRIKHAVEYTENNVQHPANTSVPKNGEIIFNSDRTNFKVGNEPNEYSELPYILPLNTIYEESTPFATSPEPVIIDIISNTNYVNNNIILYDYNNYWQHNYMTGFDLVFLESNDVVYEWLLANPYKNLKFTVIVKKTSNSDDIVDKFISIVLPYQSGGLSTAIEKVLIANKTSSPLITTDITNSGSDLYIIYRKALIWTTVGDTTQSVSNIYYGSADFSIMCVDNTTPKFVIS